MTVGSRCLSDCKHQIWNKRHYTKFNKQISGALISGSSRRRREDLPRAQSKRGSGRGGGAARSPRSTGQARGGALRGRLSGAHDAPRAEARPEGLGRVGTAR